MTRKGPGLFGFAYPPRQPAPTPEPEVEAVPFDDKVEEYRFRRFLHLGFNAVASRSLASGKADWQVAKQLLEAGADHDQAVRILA